MDRRTFGIGLLLFFGFFQDGVHRLSNEQRQTPEFKPGTGKVFIYTAKRFGVSILRATIKIENGSPNKANLFTRFVPGLNPRLPKIFISDKQPVLIHRGSRHLLSGSVREGG